MKKVKKQEVSWQNYVVAGVAVVALILGIVAVSQNNSSTGNAMFDFLKSKEKVVDKEQVVKDVGSKFLDEDGVFDETLMNEFEREAYRIYSKKEILEYMDSHPNIDFNQFNVIRASTQGRLINGMISLIPFEDTEIIQSNAGEEMIFSDSLGNQIILENVCSWIHSNNGHWYHIEGGGIAKRFEDM